MSDKAENTYEMFTGKRGGDADSLYESTASSADPSSNLRIVKGKDSLKSRQTFNSRQFFV
jgi:hypothetical protein